MQLSLAILVSLLFGLVAHAAPLPAPLPAPLTGNPKNLAAAVKGSTSSSSTTSADPVAASLASKLAGITKSLGKLPVLAVPALLEPTTTGLVIKVVSKAPVVKNAKAVSRRAVQFVNNPKSSPRQTTTTTKGRTTTTKVFGTSTGPVKVPVATAAHVDNPKHAFSPSPAVKLVKYTLTAPGGKTTVVEAQGSWSHPGEPKPTHKA
ncbi:hypothetical protein JCM3775_005102 [Rhodotorula graminis]|uniref:Uncharacterized protein n=1 Tax=Rhodotorula graminis (strain WP1) TaxID=578459 RepID=A0A194S099_RHOGW|nr:uncharacterized protein RHOBADRAFT_44638 [Rhodotorula graminis WP1]KPV74153.1 hypothetical protein RHOBADRAFT_44638 [Rhodotorula graminis WP1]